MDRAAAILLEALRQALAEPGGQRLYRAGKLPGLFPGRGGPSGEAAAAALRDGLLEIVRTEAKGKAVVEWVRLTPRGVDFLYEHESPAQAIRGLREALRVNRQAVPAWLAEMRTALAALEDRLTADAQKWQQRLEALERRLEETLRRLEAAQPIFPPDLAAAYPWALDAANYLDRRRTGGAAGPCPLPELFAALARQHPALSVAAFHEGLRRLHDRAVLRLEPADDVAALERPEFALPVAGRVLYFADR